MIGCRSDATKKRSIREGLFHPLCFILKQAIFSEELLHRVAILGMPFQCINKIQISARSVPVQPHPPHPHRRLQSPLHQGKYALCTYKDSRPAMIIKRDVQK